MRLCEEHRLGGVGGVEPLDCIGCVLELADALAKSVRAEMFMQHPSLDSDRQRDVRDKLWAYLDARGHSPPTPTTLHWC
jgi:hypothetical protein